MLEEGLRWEVNDAELARFAHHSHVCEAFGVAHVRVKHDLLTGAGRAGEARLPHEVKNTLVSSIVVGGADKLRVANHV